MHEPPYLQHQKTYYVLSSLFANCPELDFDRIVHIRAIHPIECTRLAIWALRGQYQCAKPCEQGNGIKSPQFWIQI